MAKQSQNPVANLISVPFENWLYYNVGPENETVYSLMVKPVYPVSFKNINLINRLILPVIYLEGQDVTVDTNDVGIGAGTQTVSTDDAFGLSNIQYQAFLSPAKAGKIIWGAGMAMEIPTHTKEALGSDNWSAGPAFVALAMPGKWVLGGLVQHLWNFAGPSDEPSLSKSTFQYFINYNITNGWYLTTTPTIAANWTAKSSKDIWTVPVGGGIGRLMKVGKLPVDFKLQAYYNIEKSNYGPEWTSMFAFKFLFPKSAQFQTLYNGIKICGLQCKATKRHIADSQLYIISSCVWHFALLLCFPQFVSTL